MITSFLKKYSHINWALADQAMVSGVNFLTGILLARYLGLEEYGRFTLVWMAVLFFNSFQQAGIIAPMMSIGPKQEREKEAAYYGAVLVQQLIWSVTCFFLLWIGVWLSCFIKPEWRIQNLALPLAATLFVWQLQDFLRRYFFVRGHGGLAFLNDVVSYLSQLILLLILFRLIALDTVLVFWLITGTSTLAVVVGLCQLGEISFPRGMLIEITRNHWRFSKWMLASALMQWTSGNLFIVAAGSLLGVATVGTLKAAQNLTAVSNVFFQGLENFVPVRASLHFAKNGYSGLLNYLKKVSFAGGMVMVFISMILALYPDFWLNLVYGQKLMGAGWVVRGFVLICLLNFFGLPLRVGLRTLEQTKPIFIAFVLMAGWSICTAWPLVGKFGILGVLVGILVNVLIKTLTWGQCIHVNTQRNDIASVR